MNYLAIEGYWRHVSWFYYDWFKRRFKTGSKLSYLQPPSRWVQKHNIWNPKAKLLNANRWSPEKEILYFCRCFFSSFLPFFLYLAGFVCRWWLRGRTCAKRRRAPMVWRRSRSTTSSSHSLSLLSPSSLLCEFPKSLQFQIMIWFWFLFLFSVLTLVSQNLTLSQLSCSGFQFSSASTQEYLEWGDRSSENRNRKIYRNWNWQMTCCQQFNLNSNQRKQN